MMLLASFELVRSFVQVNRMAAECPRQLRAGVGSRRAVSSRELLQIADRYLRRLGEDRQGQPRLSEDRVHLHASSLAANRKVINEPSVTLARQ
jgi:hypothetical protein